MNIFTNVLEKAAKQLNFDYKICQSDKSEAAYLLIKCYSNSNLNDVYSCLSVRFASHDANTEKSLAYQIQLDCGFNFDWELSKFETKWSLDVDGDFSENGLDEEIVFNSLEEIENYMANCLVTNLKSKT